MIGKVHWFSEQLGYGFILTGPEETIFVHRSAILGMKPGFKILKKGQTVEYEIGKYKENTVAVNVRVIPDAEVAR